MKSEKKKRIKHDNMPVGYGLATIFMLFTCLHYWDVSGWLYGVLGTIIGLRFLREIYRHATYEEVDIFEKK
jgi:hypothetical protein